MTDDRTRLPRTVMWRRIDLEGMDACSYEPSADGHVISGSALFLEGGEAATFEYRVVCDLDWSTRSAWARGWVGSLRKEISLTRDASGGWNSDGEEIDGTRGLLDVDLGFTPATNTNALRRLRLAIGEEVETTAVWLDTEDWRLKPLRQSYRRLSEAEYAYRSPAHDYAATLVTDDFGIVRDYPRLWTAVSAPSARES